MQVRLGRIYTLERSSRESRDDYGEFMEILTALIRQRAQGADHVAADARPSRKDNTAVRKSYRRQRSRDVAAALQIIIRCQSADATPKGARLSLRRTNLASLCRRHCMAPTCSRPTSWRPILLAPLYLTLRRANLIRANLVGPDLARANLSGSNLSEANRRASDLSGGMISWADLSRVTLYGANLRGTTILEARLLGGNLHRADLHGACPGGSDISGAQPERSQPATRRYPRRRSDRGLPQRSRFARRRCACQPRCRSQRGSERD